MFKSVLYSNLIIIYAANIGVASYGHWGTCPLDFQLFNFGVTSETHKHSTSRGWLSSKTAYRPIALSLFTVSISWYFCVSPFNYLLLVSCPSSHQILATPLTAKAIWSSISCQCSPQSNTLAPLLCLAIWREDWNNIHNWQYLNNT